MAAVKKPVQKKSKVISKGHKFILTLGEEGGILVHMNGVKLETRLYALGPDSLEIKQMDSLITSYPSAPIYVLLNNMDQTYSPQTLPAVSSFAISGLIKRRLERDLPENVLKSALLVGREQSGRKDWKYLFISTPINNTLTSWLDYVTKFSNKFGGVYLLPIETENLLRRLNKVFIAKSEDPSNWQFLISYNKTGGIRQSVFHNQKIVFTRLIQPEKDSLPDLIAGNIEQEISNTNEYLRRLGFSDKDTLDLYIIVSSDIKTSLESTKAIAKRKFLLTPDEASKKLGFNNISKPEDKYSDPLNSAAFAVSKPVLRFSTPTTKKIENLLMIAKFESVVVGLLATILLITNAYNGYDIYSKISSIASLENEKTVLEQQWKDNQLQGDYSIAEATKISNFISMHKAITADIRVPSDITDRLAQIIKDQAVTKNANWEFVKDNKDVNKKGVMTATFELEFKNTGNNLEELFKNFDSLTKALVDGFKEFNVEHSKLPDTITFNKKDAKIDLKVTISDKEGGSSGGANSGTPVLGGSAAVSGAGASAGIAQQP